ncbi:dGTPase [Pelagibaculum spongiae]|nr:dGTPase [Pelagibaculum spongiae]
MDYQLKLKSTRFRGSSITEPRDFNDEMESDRGRAFNSAAVRRLQQKTQVFPLETNAAIRSRLTHSLEVLQVGRYIAKTILKKLSKQSDNHFPLEFSEGFVSCIEIACLLHDIGNPPFGHFGEEAINLWAAEKVTACFAQFDDSELKQQLLDDLLTFEGNAQGLRTLHSLQTLNLSLTQLASIIKYTRTPAEAKPDKSSQFGYRQKKPGYYFSELPLIEKINQALSIAPGCRFPLVYIMEAADDISYCIADLDDAVTKGILSIEALNSELRNSWLKLSQQKPSDKLETDYFYKILDKAQERYKNNSDSSHHYILTLRTELVNDLVEYSADRYLKHHQQVFDGTLDESLLDGHDEYHCALESLRDVSVRKVYSCPEVEDLELKGFSIISGLLKTYGQLLDLSFTDFQLLVNENNLKHKIIETRLFHKISEKQKAAYLTATANITLKATASEEDRLLEFYYRTRLVIDYISSMTDHFAMAEFQNISASG